MMEYMILVLMGAAMLIVPVVAAFVANIIPPLADAARYTAAAAMAFPIALIIIVFGNWLPQLFKYWRGTRQYAPDVFPVVLAIPYFLLLIPGFLLFGAPLLPVFLPAIVVWIPILLIVLIWMMQRSRAVKRRLAEQRIAYLARKAQEAANHE